MEIISLVLSVLAILISLVDVFRSYILQGFLWFVVKEDMILVPIDEFASKGLDTFCNFMRCHKISLWFEDGSVKSYRWGFDRVFIANVSENSLGTLAYADDLSFYLCGDDANIYNCCKFYIVTRHGRNRINEYKKQKVRLNNHDSN